MKSSKFVGPSSALAALTSTPWELLSKDHLTTVYFDDADDRCYADQFRKTSRRFKVRLRTVGGESTLEVKLKGGRGESLRSLASTELDARAVEFIRACLDAAFEPGFARGIERQLRPVVTTDFHRASWGTARTPRLSIDTEVELRVGARVARLRPELALVELPQLQEAEQELAWLTQQDFRAVGFSKFGAALDLLRSDRVRSHKPQLLQSLFLVS